MLPPATWDAVLCYWWRCGPQIPEVAAERRWVATRRFAARSCSAQSRRRRRRRNKNQGNGHQKSPARLLLGSQILHFLFFFVAQRSMEMQASGVCAAAVLLLSMCLIFSAQVRQSFFCWQSIDIKERGEEEEEEERRLLWRFLSYLDPCLCFLFLVA